MNPGSEVASGPGLADGTGAIVIALAYGLLGPVIGGILLAPIASFALLEFRPDLTWLGAVVMLGAFPMSALIAYLLAGVPALATGVIIAAIAHRSGRALLRHAVLAPLVVFVVLAALDRMLGIAIPGAAIVRGGGSIAALIWLPVCVAASVICWLITLPIQRRMR
jgi:hypothetical protein